MVIFDINSFLSFIIATPFQSEALLVPSHCIFDHIHNENECKASSDWRPAAAVVCEQQQMKLLSSAPISVCGVGHFQGLEFVCCPQHLPMCKYIKLPMHI